MNEEELLTKLREAFKAEAEERVENMSSGLMALEKTSEPDRQKPILEVVFREAHSLKGAARAVNLAEIETLCQAVEGVFADLKRETISLSTDLFDVLHHCITAIENMLAASENEDAAPPAERISLLIRQLGELQAGRIEDRGQKTENGEQRTESRGRRAEDEKQEAGGKELEAEDKRQEAPPQVQRLNDSTTPTTQPSPHKSRLSETVRISTSKLDAVLLKAEELISVKLVSNQHLRNLQEAAHSFEHWEKSRAKADEELRAVRNLIRMEDHTGLKGLGSSLDNLLAFINWNQDYVRTLRKKISTLTKAAGQDYYTTGRMVDDLLDEMKAIMMLPFSTLFAIFPRMVREISRDQGKEVELVHTGEEVEIDRRILEQMKDPLIHLIRNSIDHGLEDPETREKMHKPRGGTIRLSISRIEGSKVEIVVSDDGRGIDPARVKENAVRKGILSKKEAESLTDEESVYLIFQSGVSTSSIVTDISGRGLGMAIVQENVEQLGGILSVENSPGKGILFRIQLPVTLATFRGILVQAAGSPFIVPSANVRRAVKIRLEEVRTVESRETITLNGRPMSLVNLGRVLGLARKEKQEKETAFMKVIILGTGEKSMAFEVDEILSEQEVLVKSLGRQLVRVPNIAGASILGNGSVVPILHVLDLLKFPHEHATGSDKTPDWQEDKGAKAKSILVVEDSITSRMLIKNILETAGYLVKTAVDGQDAYTVLKTENFDLVVSDVEMPRMNGFELTEKIRSDSGLAETPVVLVTSLESREDREKGIDVGANAYIIKRSFDQSNLLDVVQRLA